MLLNSTALNNTEIISIIALISSTICTVVSIFFTVENQANMKFIEKFNEIHYKTFELRLKISKITSKNYGYDFFYELNTILSMDKIEENILDYLTEVENFFSLVMKHRISKKALKKMISFAFYQRIIALYPYILYKRIESNNSNLFKNYGKAVKMMNKMKKVRITSFRNKCFIGIRESDLQYTDYFNKKICLFSRSPSDEKFEIRLNQNINNKEILPFYIEKLFDLQKQNIDSYYMFYNPMTAYNHSKNIIKNTICLNDRELLTFLNNKLALKQWLSKHNIPIVNYETYCGKDIIYSKLAHHFKGNSKFVVQKLRGGGGVGTFYTEAASFSSLIDKLEPLQTYIVSPFLDNISVNTHVFISKKQTILTPGSIQIIEEKENQLMYSGCDFCTFQKLNQNVKNEIEKLSLIIANLLRKEGYLGIAGIDFLIDKNNQIYCSEINPRFQASTVIIDLFLKNKNLDKLEASSCYELNEMAFNGNMISSISFNDKINYSCYYYYNNINNTQYIKEKYSILKKNDVEIHSDGFEYYLENGKINKNSYLFRAIFSHPICKISPNGNIWINDNIPIVKAPKDKLELKVALLNQGIRLNGEFPLLKKGTYNSVDIKIKPNLLFKNELHINCAYDVNLSKYSPYEIINNCGNATLYYYGEPISKVTVEKDKLADFSDLDRKILYLATDRLRIKMVAGCENKNIGKGCEFCNLPISNKSFELYEIISALEKLKKSKIYFRHILIGGGTSLSKTSWNNIILLCNYLKKDSFYKNKPISLMSIIPPLEVLPLLKKAGVEEVAFNLEIANEKLAKRLMPAKRKLGKDAYYEAFKHSIKIFGIGNVRSALLVGFDKDEELLNEIITLADLGVVPCLSALRPLPNSYFENDLSPSNQYLISFYNRITNQLSSSKYSVSKLGPYCKACGNNMLVL